MMNSGLAYLRQLTDHLTTRGGILVVEDDPGFADYLMRLLLALRYDRRRVSTGEKAIIAVEEECPFVTVMDLRLPGMDSIEAIKEIRKRCPNTQFIVVTSFPDEKSAIKTANIDIAAYLVKGNTYDENMDELIRVIHGLTRAREL